MFSSGAAVRYIGEETMKGLDMKAKVKASTLGKIVNTKVENKIGMFLSQ